VLAGALQGVDWLEITTENFLLKGGRPLQVLERAREQVPVVFHGVSLSIGGTDPLNTAYLSEVKALADRFQPAWVSDHLCWGTLGGHYSHELLPLPFTEEALRHVVGRIKEVQERLERQILLENVSSYLEYSASEVTEWAFLCTVVEEADCGVLLDVNNVYVNAKNHGFSAEAYVDALPSERIWQVHLAGHTDKGAYLLDSHVGPTPSPVWRLYERVVERHGAVPTLVEWDEEVPEWTSLVAERDCAAEIEAGVLSGVRACA
jgi:uncharacterized protein (UPF0276 family)